jgi:magnesium chelatase accessory protein
VTFPPANWPNRAASRSLRVGPLDWHVQVAGTGPTLLLLHGSGASAHSWADLLPRLAPHATVVAPDLPGHGYTIGAALDSLSLPRLREALAALLRALALPAPVLVVGHSAGAALALRWALDADTPPRAVLGLNPSLVAPPALYLQWIAPLLNPVATSSPVTSLLARVAGRFGLVDRLLASTGSAVPAAQRACYQRLFADPAHVRGAMGFMAAADLTALLPACAALRCPVVFVVGTRDAWIPGAALQAVLSRHFAGAEVEHWPGGHLLHEQDPARAAARVLELLTRCTPAAAAPDTVRP